jgi:double-GTPase-like protein
VNDASILLLGESGVGKTHFGAQLLRRLMKGNGDLRMNGQATNLEPFESALDSLNEGFSAGHTPTPTYLDSVWPVVDAEGRAADIVWPDYGGEQVRSMISSRRLTNDWRSRVGQAPAWMLLIRLQETRVGEDVFTRPLGVHADPGVESRELSISDQARLVELLQMLLFTAVTRAGDHEVRPRLLVLLTCWDELGFAERPDAVLARHLPMVRSFVRANWPASSSVMGLSALERPLSTTEQDDDYVNLGPEQFGYVVRPDGSRSADLTLPIKALLAP